MEDVIIKLENITKTYELKKEKIEAIKNINLEIRSKDIFGIIGLSGAGKSTLIRCINYLEKPTAGEIYFDGIKLSSLSHKELLTVRRKIGMIFQNYNLLEQSTVLKNVCFPLEIAHIKKEDRIIRAKELLDLVGLNDKINSYPSKLSGGQKQRVAIARALASNPKVLLCDEATSALDPNTTDSILDLLKKINNELGVTIIIITHEMRVIESICNKVAVIDESKIKEYGSIDEIFKHPKTKITKELICKENFFERLGNVFFEINLKGVSGDFIAYMILEYKTIVSIIKADINTIDNKIYGTLIIQLPDDNELIEKIKDFMTNLHVDFKEVEK